MPIALGTKIVIQGWLECVIQNPKRIAIRRVHIVDKNSLIPPAISAMRSRFMIISENSAVNCVKKRLFLFKKKKFNLILHYFLFSNSVILETVTEWKICFQ